jgi:site-specific recombinase
MGLFNHSKDLSEKNEESAVPVVTIDSVYRGLDYLIELIKQIRPSRPHNIKEAELKFKAFFYQLNKDKKLLYSLRKALVSQFENSSFVPALTESGLVSSRGFLQESVIKLKHKLLPPLQQPDNFLYVINHVFYKPSDYIWVAGIDKELWVSLFSVLDIHVDVKDEQIIHELQQALHILCRRVVTISFEPEIITPLGKHQYNHNPFVVLDRSVQHYLDVYENHADQFQHNQAVKRIIDSIEACNETIEFLKEHRKDNGTSLSQIYMLMRIEQLLERLMLICDILDNEKPFNADKFLEYFIRVIVYEKKKNSLRAFLSSNFSFLAYKITEHGGARGEKYITTTRKEYWQMIKSAMGGGFIISFTAVIKNLLTRLALPVFWQGFAYSVNYSIGFQLMHETHTTLATKQPAFTASALATSLDSVGYNRRRDMLSLVITIARTIRSQFASFFGNLIIVFPLANLLAALYKLSTGELLVSPKTANKILLDQHPLLSFSILYACFTGFFLFLSGLIAGYVENSMHYGKVGERLKNHPIFKNTIPASKLQKITKYVEDNMGSLIGNVSLGFFLGMASSIGHIFGIPFDIRHITISAGNTGIAYFTLGPSAGTAFLLTVVGGVFLIGFFNFFVSFSLAFLVAIKSRGVKLRDYPELFTLLAKFFFNYPGDFIFPPKAPRNVDEVRLKLAGIKR